MSERCEATNSGEQCHLEQGHSVMHYAEAHHDDRYSEFWWDETPDGGVIRQIRSNYSEHSSRAQP